MASGAELYLHLSIAWMCCSDIQQVSLSYAGLCYGESCTPVVKGDCMMLLVTEQRCHFTEPAYFKSCGCSPAWS